MLITLQQSHLAPEPRDQFNQLPLHRRKVGEGWEAVIIAGHDPKASTAKHQIDNARLAVLDAVGPWSRPSHRKKP